MHLSKLASLSSILILANVLGTVADVDFDEVPHQCIDVCRPVVHGSKRCDKETRGDTAEKECMCKLDNAARVIPKCEACVAKFHHELDDDDDDDDDDGPHDNGMLPSFLIFNVDGWFAGDWMLMHIFRCV